jgi:hypothetical protein
MHVHNIHTSIHTNTYTSYHTNTKLQIEIEIHIQIRFLDRKTIITMIIMKAKGEWRNVILHDK